MIVRRIAAQAWLAAPSSEIDEARMRADAGDPDWKLWVDELDRGEATLADMRVEVTVELDDGSAEKLSIENHSIWLQLALQTPALEAVIAELSSKDFEVLAARITRLGLPITVAELEDMHVAVSIGEDLQAALRPSGSGDRQGTDADARLGITTENA